VALMRLKGTDMKVCVLVPAYKCGDIIGEVCRRVPLSGPDDEIIVVDDCSPDNTAEAARGLPRVFVQRNPANLGYGGTSRRLYQLACERGAELAVSIHGDLGHRPEDIPLLLEAFEHNPLPDIVIGSRLLHLFANAKEFGWSAMLTRPDARVGMPFNRFLGHVVLTQMQNLVYRSQLHSFHEGMRACRRHVMEWIVNSGFPDGYGYDNELMYQAHKRGFRIHEVPVPPSYDARANTAASPYKYGMTVFRHMLRVALTGK
jgi:glycosyltransferase involved in cell wall biosynthesis